MNELSSLFQDLSPAVDFSWAGRLYVFFLLVGVPFLALLQAEISIATIKFINKSLFISL